MDQFIANELVWVKLGGVFWPAVIKDKTECSEFLQALKNEPIAVAEFFDKKLQDVHRTCDIFRYNSEEKDELIAKGIQMTKNKVDLALTFKKHVITAEKLSDGDVHILSRSRMLFDQEQDHSFRSVALFDGKAGAQRLPLTNGSRVKLFSATDRPRSKLQATAKSKKSKGSAADNRVLNITHPRFVVENDHCSKDLIQGSGEEAPGASGSFQCYRCPFRCTRVNVIVLHIRAHVRNALVAGVDAVAAKRRLNGDASAPRKKKAKTGGDGGGVRKTSAKPSDPAKSKKKKVVAGQNNDRNSAGGEVKLSPQKQTSAKPMLLVDWEEDDDEETAERLKIQSDISKLFGDSSGLMSAPSQSSDVIANANSPARDDITPSDSAAVSVDGASAAADSDSDDGAMFSDDEPSAQSTLVSRLSGEWGDPYDESEDEANANASATCDRSGGEEDTEGKSDEEHHPAIEETDQDEERLEQERKDALLLAAVDDVLMETAPSSEMSERLAVGADVRSVSLRTDELSGRLQPSGTAECSVVSGVGLSGRTSSAEVHQSESKRSRLDVESLHTPAVVSSRQPVSSGGDLTVTAHTTTRPPVFDVPEAGGQQQPCAVLPDDSAPGAVVSLPANLQVLSVPGGGSGADDTFLLVAVDERGDVRAVSPRHSAVAALQSDTLLAYETLREDGSAGTAYLTPAQLASPSDADIARLLSTAAAADSVAQTPATPSSVAAAPVEGVTTALAGSLTEKPLML